MADGKWVMTDEDAKRIDLSFGVTARHDMRTLPNYGQHRIVDDRMNEARKRCAFCGSDHLEAGFGGYGEGFGYRSCKCADCGGTTDFVYKDEIGKYFK